MRDFREHRPRVVRAPGRKSLDRIKMENLEAYAKDFLGRQFREFEVGEWVGVQVRTDITREFFNANLPEVRIPGFEDLLIVFGQEKDPRRIRPALWVFDRETGRQLRHSGGYRRFCDLKALERARRRARIRRKLRWIGIGP